MSAVLKNSSNTHMQTDDVPKRSLSEYLLFPEPVSQKSSKKRDRNPFYCVTGPDWKNYEHEKVENGKTVGEKKEILANLKKTQTQIKSGIAAATKKSADAQKCLNKYKAELQLLIIENKETCDRDEKDDLLKKIQLKQSDLDQAKTLKEEALKEKKMFLNQEKENKEKQKLMRKELEPLTKKMKIENIAKENVTS